MGGIAFQHAYNQYLKAYAAWQVADDAWHRRQQYSGPPPGPAPRDEFAPYERGNVNTARDQALSIVEQFLQIMGWPAGIDERGLELGILQSGTYLSPEQAYNWLFTQLSPELQKANPNAEFGMTFDAYVTSTNAFKDAYENLTGTSDIPPDVLRMAIDQQWTQAELTRFLQNDKRWSDPSQLPWLHQGVTYRDVKNQFFAAFGKNPVDVKQLSSWYGFRLEAQQVGSQQVATQQSGTGPVRGLPSQSEVR
jgi:hypothetical protein